MAPPPPPPPELTADVISEILLRLPPNDPACLVRASLVYKPWRRLLTDGAFLRRYRAFHRTPPVLGFFQDQYRKGTGSVHQYVPTIQASPPVPQPSIAVAGSPTTSSCCRIVDCRHGRVLFQARGRDERQQRSLTFIVWDPITGDQKRISPPAHPYTDNTDEFMAAVLCAADGCDHLGCSGAPFLVLIVGIYYGDEDDDGDPEGGCVTWASLYSSNTGAWSAPTSIALESFFEDVLPSLLAGDAIYFILENGERILKYSLVGGDLSVMSAPPQGVPNMIFAAAQDGELGAATVEGYSLHLWSWRTDRDDVGAWARCRVIELDVMIPMSIALVTPRLHFIWLALRKALAQFSSFQMMTSSLLN